MELSKSTYVRIREGNDYSTSVEDWIKEIEKEFKIDFRSLPEWQNLIKRLHVAKTDCLRKIQCANFRKSKIIEKLFVESTRISPFELVDIRAAKRSSYQGKPKIPSMPTLEVTDEVVEEEKAEGEEIEENIFDVDDPATLHPNTENSSVLPSFQIKVDAEVQCHSEAEKQTATSLPVFIYTNTHKLISPIGSVSPLSYHSVTRHAEPIGESEVKEWEPSSTAVICNPTTIRIANKTIKQQCVLFSLTNCTSEYLHVRLKYVTNQSPFKNIKLVPNIPKRLYPGIAVVFKLTYKLRYTEDFKTGLYFRIGRDVYANAPTEPFFVPILGMFTSGKRVTISDTVNIPPVYPWHIKMSPESEYPSGTVKIRIDEPLSYHLRIYKRTVDLSEESNLSMNSTGFNTDILKECDSFLDSGTLNSKALENSQQELIDAQPEPNTSVTMEIIPENSIDMIFNLVDELVELALEVFVFDSTYILMDPQSEILIPVYLTKFEHIGYHHNYFDIDLIDPETNAVLLKNTIKVLAEVLPHPINITPILLDMSKSPISHGYFEDQFIVTNNHKLYPATIYIKLTTKMKKVFSVAPMKCTIPAQSRVTFKVKFCTSDHLSPKPCEDLVHFTFKIIIAGIAKVYKNVPPIFYELIAPCAMEFKKIYNEKYFKEVEELQPLSQHEIKQ